MGYAFFLLPVLFLILFVTLRPHSGSSAATSTGEKRLQHDPEGARTLPWVTSAAGDQRLRHQK